MSSLKRLLIANRAEIAVRIARAAEALDIESVAVFSEDDALSRHVQIASTAVGLPGTGARAYLDVEAVVGAAVQHGCDAVHPGYGFLSEQSMLARRVEEEGLTFVGPTPSQLELFGDKTAAREAAIVAGVDVAKGSDGPVSLDEAEAFLSALGDGAAIILKAVAGGGGRGSRVITDPAELASAYERCSSEAKAAFGIDLVYIEEFVTGARHIEVQIAGDGRGQVVQLGDRDCSVQRRFQKLVEIAPAPNLSDGLRGDLAEAAVALASSVGYRSLGTVEFLVRAPNSNGGAPFVFLETNARLQVEHTVTEEVMGVDLVQAQLRLAAGASLDDAGLVDASTPRGFAIQSRVNLETVELDGSVRPGGGTISAYEPPGGPGVRVDGYGYAGYTTSPNFDSLLAKVVVHSNAASLETAARKARNAVTEFRLDGVSNNLGLLAAILDHEDFRSGSIHTNWFEQHLAELVPAAAPDDSPSRSNGEARSNDRDPLGLFAHDARNRDSAEALRGRGAEGPDASPVAPEGTALIVAPMQGTVVSVDVVVGSAVPAGAQVAVIEAMKMEHVISAPHSGVIETISVAVGDVVEPGGTLSLIRLSEVEGGQAVEVHAADLDHIRDDLREVIDRHEFTLDAARPNAVERRRSRGYRMPRENIERLLDDGSFTEYWPLVVARQHSRHDMETLRRDTPADGLVAGLGTINADLVGEERARAMVVSYDYTVLAGTQGSRNHYKQDRMYELAVRFRLPVVLFGEGGGGRPGDDRLGPGVAFDTHTFTQFSQLSALVPMIAIVNGRTFAGNTALVAACDVIIATRGSTLAMGGPAMIEGGGLGMYTPEEVGPMSFQVPNGVVDVLVDDEDAAVDAAKRYLSYFQGPIEDWTAPDQRALRHVVPENRLRLYDMREVIRTIADEDSVFEIRESFGVGVITAFIRIEGRPMGLIANNPHHLAGAIDSDGADKGARFMQLCDAFDIPILSLMDCPGIMVGPDVERTGLVRHSVRMFNVGANLSVPLFGVIVRKAYGLGVQAMCGASSLVGFFTVAWPTAEFAGMNIEGSVKLGFRKELAAIDDADERRDEFDRRVARAYESARAINAVVGGGVDDVIDPAETRRWVATSLKRLPPTPQRDTKKYPCIDPW